MVKAIAINLLISFIRKYPNDTDLGREIRKYIKETYGVE